MLAQLLDWHGERTSELVEGYRLLNSMTTLAVTNASLWQALRFVEK